MSVTIGVDVGGTKIQVAAVRRRRVVGAHRLSTPTTGTGDLVTAVGEAIAATLGEAETGSDDLRAIGMGIPGSVDSAAGTVASAHNIPGFEGSDPIPLADMISRAAGNVPVRLDNDVRVGVLGEWKRGAGRGFRNLLGVWVGTGVGGGLVLNGRLVVGAGAAGEIGHTIVKPEGRLCSDGKRGHLEAYAGRGRMEDRARRMAKEGHKTILFELMEKRGRTRVSSGVIVAALEKDDHLTTQLVEDAVWALGVACASAQNLLSLEAIVIGGGLGDRLGPPFVERIAEAMRPHLFLPDRAPAMLGTAFGDLSGAVGGAVLAGG